MSAWLKGTLKYHQWLQMVPDVQACSSHSHSESMYEILYINIYIYISSWQRHVCILKPFIKSYKIYIKMALRRNESEDLHPTGPDGPPDSSQLLPKPPDTRLLGIHWTCWAKVTKTGKGNGENDENEDTNPEKGRFWPRTGDPSQLRRADGARQIPFQLGCCGRRSNILSMAALVAWKTPVKKHRGWNLLELWGWCHGFAELFTKQPWRSWDQQVRNSRCCTFLADEKTEQICRNLLTDCPLKIDFPQSFAVATWMCISVSKCECYVTL